MRRIAVMRHYACAVLVLLFAMQLATVSTSARGREIRTVCSATKMFSSTAGLRGKPLRHGDRVIVVKHSSSNQMVYVVASNGQGWISPGALCRGRR